MRELVVPFQKKKVLSLLSMQFDCKAANKRKIYLMKIAQLLVKDEVYLILVISCPTFTNRNNSNGDASSLVLTLRVI